MSWDLATGGGPARLWQELAQHGFAVCRVKDAGAEAARDPWAFTERLLGRLPLLCERQPIRPTPGGRSFASGDGPAPLHTDSQRHRGLAPHVQIMACARPAERGGESLLLDTWALLSHLQRADPGLYRALFEVPRRIPFVFGDFYGTTVSWRQGHLVFTHAPVQPAGDQIAARLAAVLAQQMEGVRALELRLRTDEVLVVHNHRMLHGRRGFQGPGREFTRILSWSPGPFAAPAELCAQARRAAQDLGAVLAGWPQEVQVRFGVADPAPPQPELELVLAMLRGVPPGVLAARSGVPEPTLYDLRDAVLCSAQQVLAGTLTALPADHQARGAGAMDEVLAAALRGQVRTPGERGG